MLSGKAHTIVFIESAAAMGGVQFSTLYLAQNLNPAHWQPVVVCPEEGDLTRACHDAGIETRIVNYPRLWSTSVRVGRSVRLPNPFAWIWNLGVMWRAAQRLKSVLCDSSPAVVVTKGLASHFIGGLAARSLGLRCVWHVQDFISERNLGIYRWIFGFAAMLLPQQIIVDGAAIKQQLPASLQSRISVIHNGIDTSEFRPGIDDSEIRTGLGIRKDQIVIGHAGRITPWKGQHLLIEAFARIANDYPEACLLIVGSPVFDNDAYENRLRSMVAEFRLNDRIRFAGYRHDLSHVLAAMNIFAFTSIEKDTSPLALLSAMSTGLPIVAFDIPGVRELSGSGEQFLWVPVGRTEELSAALTTLISDSALRSSLGKTARRTAEQKFSLHHYVNRAEEVLVTSTERMTEKLAHPAVNRQVPALGKRGFLRNKKKFRYTVAAAIFLIALTTRLAFVNYVQVGSLAGGDGTALKTMALSMLHGQAAHSGEGYAFRPPAFPLLMAQVYRFGENDKNILILQSIIGALSALMLYLLLIRYSIAVAISSALILTFHPLMLLFTKQLLTENLYIFLLILIAYFGLRAVENGLWSFAVGGVWGLLILTRSESIFTVLPMIAAVCIISQRQRVFKFAVASVLAALMVSPWVYRNYKLLGHVTLNTATGVNLYMSFNPKATGGFYYPDEPEGFPNGEAERSQFYAKKAFEFIREHPIQVITLAGAKQAHLWEQFHNKFLDLGDLLLVPLAFVGMIFTCKRKNYLLLFAPILGISFVFLFFEAVSRYRVPMYPFLFTFASIAMVRLSKGIQHNRFVSSWAHRSFSKTHRDPSCREFS